MSNPREPHPIDLILPTLPDVRTIVEIGCHRMEDTAFLRQTFPAAKIIAFDPDPRNAALIRGHGLPARLRVTFVEVALAERNGLAQLHLSTNHAATPEADWTRSSSLRRPRNPAPVDLLHRGIVPCVFKEETEAVWTTRLDSYIDDHPEVGPIDLIWCDAQGAEDLIIAGAELTLRSTRWLFLEHNTDGCYVAAPDREVLEFMLPNWEVLHVWPHDMLLRNRAL